MHMQGRIWTASILGRCKGTDWTADKWKHIFDDTSIPGETGDFPIFLSSLSLNLIIFFIGGEQKRDLGCCFQFTLSLNVDMAAAKKISSIILSSRREVITASGLRRNCEYHRH